jgi:hypothetical protein
LAGLRWSWLARSLARGSLGNAGELVLGLGQGRAGCMVETEVGFIAAGAGVGAGLARRGAARGGLAPRACSGVARAHRTRGRVHLPKFLRLQRSQPCESRQRSCARFLLPGT